MQASVHTYDETTGAGSVLLDDGRQRPFAAEVLEESGLRRLRPGQRVSIEVDDDVVCRLWIVGISGGGHVEFID